MKNFSYTALETKGKEVKGTVAAVDLKEAIQRVHELGLFPLQIREKTKALVAGKSPGVKSLLRLPKIAWPHWSIGNPIKPKVLVAFTRQLATLVDSGLPLLRGLRLLEQQETNRGLKRILRTVGQSIEDGSSFSEALSQHPRVFNRLFLNMVKAGEIGGVMDLTLERLAEFLEKAQKIKAKVVAAMFYPVAVLTAAITILSVLMVFVVPKFKLIFADLVGPNHKMPPFTEFVLSLSDTVASHLFLSLGLAGGLIFLLVTLGKTRPGRRVFDSFKLQMPVLGPVIRKAAIARFARTLGTLIHSGVPILQALTIVKETAGNMTVASAVENIHSSVKEGETITQPAAASGIFPVTVVGMIDVGEQTGALPEMLLKVADNYDDEVDNAVAAMTSLLEPIMIVFLAIVVGSIVIALFLPLIDIINNMSGPSE